MATVALHLGVLVFVLTGLPEEQPKKAATEPVEIQLLRPAPAISQPHAPASEPARPAPQPPEAEKAPSTAKVRPKPEPRTKREPAARQQPTVPAPAGTPKTSSAIPATTPPAPSVAAQGPAPSPPAQPARTSASEAAYAPTNRKPPYPRLSRINEEEGIVVLRVLVKEDGTAGPVEIKHSSGYPLLDESARSTVQAWRFKPATVDGKPVSEWYQLSIPFTLQKN